MVLQRGAIVLCSVVRMQLTGKSGRVGAAEGRSCLLTALQKPADCFCRGIRGSEMNDRVKKMDLYSIALDQQFSASKG